jgi:hypothetical protein
MKVPTTCDRWLARGITAGTHHSVLTIRRPHADRDTTAARSLEFQMLYAAGVGTMIPVPDRRRDALPAGTYVNLNLHLFNATDNPPAD